MKKQLTKPQWETAVEKWERIRDGFAGGKAVKVLDSRCTFCEVWRKGEGCPDCPLEQAAVCSRNAKANGGYAFWQLVTLSGEFDGLDGLELKASVAQSAVLADTILTAVKAAEPAVEPEPDWRAMAMGLADKSKNIGDFTVANGAFAVLLDDALTEGSPLKLEWECDDPCACSTGTCKDGKGGNALVLDGDSVYYDLAVIVHGEHRLCIPVPLITMASRLAIVKADGFKFVKKLVHERKITPPEKGELNRLRQDLAEVIGLAALLTAEGVHLQEPVDAGLDALLASGDANALYSAGRRWPNSRYNARILDALIATGDALQLYFAGHHWPDARYSPRILAALIATGDARQLYDARSCWPAGRCNKKSLTAAIVAGWEKKEATK